MSLLVLFDGDAAPPPTVTGHGGLHTISNGIGDPGVAVVPQTMHTIEQGISA